MLLQRAEIEALASNGSKASTAPDDGMTRLNRDRAQALLGSDFSAQTIRGCRMARSIPSDAQWLVLRQIELGQAVILRPDALGFAPHAVVHYFGSAGKHFGAGFIDVKVPGVAEPIYVLPWWMT